MNVDPGPEVHIADIWVENEAVERAGQPLPVGGPVAAMNRFGEPHRRVYLLSRAA
ncbi:hypothetical protein FP2506_13224 [Fulvimarina pelagi HTCC2506]|uniref:Uncharacterized protein n=1 Tax=Fulvimarina pelagi HTCC2506 TaxID=314231 RepID=Q0FXD6_9HYPH|nr:hypothetical protein FP2506_13224 [Fulvimarina pelagi HTCC2506]